MADELFDHVYAAATAELARLIDAIAKASIDIRLEFPYRMGIVEGEENKYGEQQLKLDQWTNQYLCDRMIETNLVKAVYSEELVQPASGLPDAPYVVCMDPLDGSSNVKSNNTCGTIVSIYKREIGKGSEQVAALFKLYGPVTTLTYTVGKGTHQFIQQLKHEPQYVLSHENITLPKSGGVFGIGGKKKEFTPALTRFAEGLEARGLKLRYSGTMVADCNQVLHYGGLFAYPKPKLRLNYEAKPMAFILEQAGGSSTNGIQSLMEVVSDTPDARTPVFLGSKELISEIERLNR
ncbi:fructose-1,6-bisphosphatase [Candidatus Micrarchaeota archaeon]|nr:fructose-1,6-bisphosphatase [Candidatus Micrarchaeota archaeon]